MATGNGRLHEAWPRWKVVAEGVEGIVEVRRQRADGTCAKQVNASSIVNSWTRQSSHGGQACPRLMHLSIYRVNMGWTRGWKVILSELTCENLRREMQRLKVLSCRRNGGNLRLKNLRIPIRPVFYLLSGTSRYWFTKCHVLRQIIQGILYIYFHTSDCRLVVVLLNWKKYLLLFRDVFIQIYVIHMSQDVFW